MPIIFFCFQLYKFCKGRNQFWGTQYQSYIAYISGLGWCPSPKIKSRMYLQWDGGTGLMKEGEVVLMAAEAAYSLQGHLISEAVGGEGRKELAASTVLPCFSCTHSGIPKKPKPNVPTLITTKSHCWRAQLHREQQKSGEKFLSVNSSTKNPLEVMAHKSPQFKPNSESRPSLLC